MKKDIQTNQIKFLVIKRQTSHTDVDSHSDFMIVKISGNSGTI